MENKEMVGNYYLVDVQGVNRYGELEPSEECFSFDTKEEAIEKFNYIDEDYLNVRVEEKTSKFYITLSYDFLVIEEKYINFE